MIQFKLAYHHLVKNKNQSLPFIFSNTIWVAVVYIFLAMLYDTNLKNIFWCDSCCAYATWPWLCHISFRFSHYLC